MIMLKKDEEEAKKRINAWWEGEITDRPPIILTAPKMTAKPYEGPDTSNLDDWWTNPDFVLPRLKHELLNTAWLGEAFPKVHPFSTGLVAILAQYLGAENKYIDKSTTWSGETIENWENRQPIELRDDNIFWQKTLTLLDKAVEMIREEELKAYLGIPDLNGPTEVLSGLRNPQNFSMDFYDNPGEIKTAFREVQDAWYKAYEITSQKAHQLGGWFNWMSVWSDVPMADLQSDVSCLVSPDQFQEYFIPFIREQTERIPRTIYHLDGPDAVRHTDALLDLPELDAVQWVHGAGKGPMIHWADLLKKIQRGGKKLWIACQLWEMEPLLRELDPRGCLFITNAASEEEGLQVLEYVEKNWKNW